MSTYTPRPGTVAFRALAHLESLDPGAEISTAQLAEAIDVPPNNLMPCMQAGVKGGAFFGRQKDQSHRRSPFFWSLVDHTNTQARGSQHVLKAEAARPDATDRETLVTASPRVGATGTGQPADAGSIEHGRPGLLRVRAGTAPFRCGIFTDGELHLEKGASRIVLDRVEFESLVHFLERMAETAA